MQSILIIYRGWKPNNINRIIQENIIRNIHLIQYARNSNSLTVYSYFNKILKLYGIYNIILGTLIALHL